MPPVAKPAAKSKLTLRVSDDLLQTVHEAVALGLASSPSAFVEEAVRARSREVRHARMRRLAAEAVADPGFIEDMRETTAAFAPVQDDPWQPEADPLPASAPKSQISP